MTDEYVVKSKVADYIRGKDLQMAGDLPEGLSKIVKQVIDEAIMRAKENGRKTVQPKDL
jgi:histone H3/H4